MLLLKQNTTGKELVNKLLELESELNIKYNIEYKIEAIKDSIVYTTKVIS